MLVLMNFHRKFNSTYNVNGHTFIESSSCKDLGIVFYQFTYLAKPLVLCLMELTADKDSDVTNTDEEWTQRVDRGGLWYVKNTTYFLFVAIEEEVRKCLKQLLKGSGHKSAIIKHVVESEEVEFHWLIAQADFDVGDEETYKLLLHKIVKLFVTVRGYSYASNLMEKHKQATAKGTQQAKALRRELHDSTD